MTINHHCYHLQDGYIQNWLAAGPQVTPLSEDEMKAPRDEIAKKMYAPELEIKNQPVERGKMTEGVFTVGSYQGSWEYARCQEDHRINHSGAQPAPAYLRSWGYIQLVSAEEVDVLLALTTPGPADMWMNHKHLARKVTFNDGRPDVFHILVRLARGSNKIFIRFENLANPTCAHYAALRVCRLDGAPFPSDGDIDVQIPTMIIQRLLKPRRQIEELFDEVYLERDVFEKDQKVVLLLPDNKNAETIVTIRFMDANNVIFLDGAVEGTPGMRRMITNAYQLTGGRYGIRLLPRVYEYYELNMRIKKEMPVWTVGNAAYSAEPYGTYAGRRIEALSKGSEQNNLFGEIAKMTAGRMKRVEEKNIREALERVKAQQAGSELDLAGLLGMVYRFSGLVDFPADITRTVDVCACNFQYNVADMSGSPNILCACQILAGQRQPESVFAGEGRTGLWHRQEGERKALEWMQAVAARGYADWGSCDELTHDLIALSLLADLAEDVQVQEMAVVSMDKLLFTLAVNSYRGILGAAQRRVEPTDLKGGILQAVSGITRLMWGMGVFNHRNEGYVSLACTQNYELPAIIASAAADFSGELWGREQHAFGGPGDGSPVNRVTYRSPDGMLASAQDYTPGRPGRQEQVWQATLGPSAVVFTNHPGCSVDEAGMMPGFWTGSACLPRVAQWKNALAAIYNLPADDWMGFTHAYFPTFAFDEYILRGGWAFAHKGSGYLAITSSAGIELTSRGAQSFRELRSTAARAVWICHLGRAAQDGDFTAFQEKVLGLPVRYEDHSVTLHTLQGDELMLGDSGPFLVNGVETALDGFPHFENPYTITQLDSSQMDIGYLNDVVRLDFKVSPGG